MILVTVGAQMPFDRLVRAVDTWAGRNGRTDVFAQIGPTEWRPKHIDWTPFLAPAEFRQKMAEARWLISHAGMGSILTALQCGTPMLVMPRRGDLGETRNDHQVATATRLQELGRVAVAWDERELSEQLDAFEPAAAAAGIGPYASDELIETVRRFLNNVEVQ